VESFFFREEKRSWETKFLEEIDQVNVKISRLQDTSTDSEERFMDLVFEEQKRLLSLLGESVENEPESSLWSGRWACEWPS